MAKKKKDDKDQKRPRIAFDPEDPIIREALNYVGSEMDIAPGDVINLGTIQALIDLLENNPEMQKRLITSRQLRFGRGLHKGDLLKRLKGLMGKD